MANSQIYPQSTYPLTGDIASTPGVPDVRVTGIQKTPVIDQAPLDGQILIFDEATSQYVPGDPVVSGPNDVGTEATRPPVQVGGIDEGNLVRELRTDTYGGIRSVRLETLLEHILWEIRAMKAAIINLDNTARDSDYSANNFSSLT